MPRERARGEGGIFQRRGRGPWYVKYSHPGHKPICESSHSTDHDVAVALLERRKKELARNQVIGPRADKLKLGVMMDDMLRARRHNDRRSDTSSNVKTLIEFFGADAKVVHINLDELRRYVAWRRARPAR